MKNEFDFESEFTSDEEVEEMIDSLVIAVGGAIMEEDSKTAVVNPYKVQQVAYAYKMLKYLTKGMKGVSVSYVLHKPFKSMGSVSVVGKNLEFRKPDWFIRAVSLASNFDVYPKTDGTVKMDLTFHGLTKSIE